MADLSGEVPKSVGLYDKPLVVEGRRQRKSIETFAITHIPRRPTSDYKGGWGAKLGDITRIEHSISKSLASDLKSLHRICFDRPGNKLEIKKNLRGFNGFPFDKDSELYSRKRTALSKFTKSGLRQFLQILDLSVTGSKEEQIERVLEFLLQPQDSGRGLPKKKRRKSSSSGRKASKKAKLSASEEDLEAEEDEGSDHKSESETEAKEENEARDPEEEEEKEQLEEGAPTDTELFYDVQDVLKGADLETLTANSVCQQIFDKYAGVDMTSRRGYIKSCIEKLLTST